MITILKVILTLNLILMIFAIYKNDIYYFLYYFIYQACIICSMLVGPPSIALFSLIYFKEVRQYWMAFVFGIIVGITFFEKVSFV